MIQKRKKLFAHFRERFLGKFIIVKNGKKIIKKFNNVFIIFCCLFPTKINP